ncbi:MAG: S-adenosylmethionine decarboxylase proenzyme [Caldisericia bacterium]|nr:S-adenosylmethionine decarboxylase proenzyme [Caldisericia bacterium]
METKGMHLILELSGCDREIINDIEKVRQVLTEAAIVANAEILETVFHKFSPQGVSGVVVISESHLSIHTWPEKSYAAIDIYTCGKHTMPWEAYKYIKRHFKAKKIYLTSLQRGEFEGGIYKHKIEKVGTEEGEELDELDVVSR